MIRDNSIINHENHEPAASEIEAVRLAARTALEIEEQPERYAEILLTDDASIHVYNREYRGVDRPTDVLSFPQDEGGELISPPDGFLGDIVISVPRAAEQGRELGHSTERELAFLTVHGILHLLGYDHIDPDDETIMLEHQRRIMNSPCFSQL